MRPFTFSKDTPAPYVENGPEDEVFDDSDVKGAPGSFVKPKAKPRWEGLCW